jgi:hypothetical protein
MVALYTVAGAPQNRYNRHGSHSLALNAHNSKIERSNPMPKIVVSEFPNRAANL